MFTWRGLNCEKSLTCSHKQLAPTLHPQRPPSNPPYPHMWHNFKLAEDDIGTSDFFLIQNISNLATKMFWPYDTLAVKCPNPVAFQIVKLPPTHGLHLLSELGNWFAVAGDSPAADFPMLLHGPKREVNCLTETEGLSLKCHKVGTFGSYYWWD